MSAAPHRKPPHARSYDPEHFVLTMLFSADPALAARADDAGIDRIGLDLEVIGKAERQKGLKTWVSPHREQDLVAMRQAVRRGQLFCRVNPIHAGSKAEIDRVIGHGVDVLMLPMFTTPDEVKAFVDHVAGRAQVVLLLEHRSAADRVEEIVRIPGIDNVHVGLTDLALSLNAPNRFGLWTTPLLDRIAAAVHAEGIRLCVGGIGRVCDDQPIPTDLVYGQYPRLNATGALVSRTFFGTVDHATDLTDEIRRCRERMAWWRTRAKEELDLAQQQLREKVLACPTW